MRGHWQSVEMGDSSQGVPDSNYCIEGVEGWVEYKQTHAWSVRFRPTQPGWIMRRTRAGGRVWVAVRRWRTVSGVDQLWMIPGQYVVDLQHGGLEVVELVAGVWHGGPRRWNWDEVRRLLVSQW